MYKEFICTNKDWTKNKVPTKAAEVQAFWITVLENREVFENSKTFFESSSFKYDPWLICFDSKLEEKRQDFEKWVAQSNQLSSRTDENPTTSDPRGNKIISKNALDIIEDLNTQKPRTKSIVSPSSVDLGSDHESSVNTCKSVKDPDDSGFVYQAEPTAQGIEMDQELNVLNSKSKVSESPENKIIDMLANLTATVNKIQGTMSQENDKITRIEKNLSEKINILDAKRLNAEVDAGVARELAEVNEKKIKSIEKDINEIRNKIATGQLTAEGFSQVELVGAFNLYQASRKEYRSAINVKQRGGFFTCNFLNNDFILTARNEDEQNFVDIHKFQRFLHRDARITVDEFWQRQNGKYMMSGRFLGSGSSTRSILKNVLENRRRFKGILGIRVQTPEKYRIDYFLQYLVQNCYDNRKKLFTKYSYNDKSSHF